MTIYTDMAFYLPDDGETEVTLFGFSGRKIAQKIDFLTKGIHKYRISGLEKGIYIASVKSEEYFVSGKLISFGVPSVSVSIIFKNTYVAAQEQYTSKSSCEEIMQFSFGDVLKLTSKSGIYSTVVMDSPEGSKTINFNHVACTDGDHNNYPVVKIGSQLWMAENLKTTCYNNGEAIPLFQDKASWIDVITGAYCWYEEFDPDNNSYIITTRGPLYNWYAVDSGDLCPVGWHIPSYSDWAGLVDYLTDSGYGYEGSGYDIAKSLAASSGWHTDETSGNIGNHMERNNSSGFTALPGGARSSTGRFFQETAYLPCYDCGLFPDWYYGCWWSSTWEDGYGGYTYSLYYDYGFLLDGLTSPPLFGHSVRCILN